MEILNPYLEIDENQVKKSWSNTDNLTYYENIDIEFLKSCAAKGGFESGCDIEVIYNKYVNNTHSIIDVGAGYGRAIKKLISLGYKGEITAVERSEKLCNYIKETHREVKVIQSDIKNFKPPKKTDAILWMWSNISDFSKQEHTEIIGHITSWLKKGGYFIMDLFSLSQKPMDSSFFDNQVYIYKTIYGTVYGYIPSEDEIHNYAKKTNIKLIEKIPYSTDTDRKRTVFVFAKN